MTTNDEYVAKKPTDYAVKKSISLPGVMWDASKERRRQIGFGTFSDYVQHLMRKDLFQAPTEVR
jgi:hypothetical protein